MEFPKIRIGWVPLAFALVLGWAGLAAAYPTYDQGCNDCHGGFQENPYRRLGADQNWGTDLMSGHLNVISQCGVCHGASLFDPVALNSSNGPNGFTISCIGCHGRDEGGEVGVDGAGLREHHRDAGISTCANTSCHANDPAPPLVGEDVLPPYYDLDLAVVSLTDPCNPGGMGEDYAGGGSSGVGNSVGLDNDGDGLYDEDDVVDCPEPAGVALQLAALGTLGGIVRMRRTRRS
jgi:hypothetical protein